MANLFMDPIFFLSNSILKMPGCFEKELLRHFSQLVSHVYLTSPPLPPFPIQCGMGMKKVLRLKNPTLFFFFGSGGIAGRGGDIK